MWALGMTALPGAQAGERPGDAAHVHALRGLDTSAAALARDIVALTERVPDEVRFGVYLTFNRLSGARSQIALTQALLAQSIEAGSPEEEDALRMTLRDQARFALWDIENTRREIEQEAHGLVRVDHRDAADAVRSLLSEVVAALRLLLVDQCARFDCVSET